MVDRRKGYIVVKISPTKIYVVIGSSSPYGWQHGQTLEMTGAIRGTLEMHYEEAL